MKAAEKAGKTVFDVVQINVSNPKQFIGLLIGGSVAFLFSALIGLESLVLNQGIKRLFRRPRPTEAGDPRYPVRRPSTSSFPSGHVYHAVLLGGLVMALVLMIEGMSADEAISHIRKCRSQHVLSNQHFERWLRTEAQNRLRVVSPSSNVA